jgi:hypothetical protein
MSVEFVGSSDNIIFNNVIKTVGQPLISFLLKVLKTEHGLSLSELLTWVCENDELDLMIKTLTNEHLTLESFMIQMYFSVKKSYVTDKQESIRRDLEELDICLQKNIMSENKCLIKIIGEKRRLLRLITASDDEE